MRPAGIWSSDWMISAPWGTGTLRRGRKVTTIETSDVLYRSATIVKGAWLSGTYELSTDDGPIGRASGGSVGRELRFPRPYQGVDEYRLVDKGRRFELLPLHGLREFGWVSCHPHFPRSVYASLHTSNPLQQVFIAWIAVLDFNKRSTKKM